MIERGKKEYVHLLFDHSLDYFSRESNKMLINDGSNNGSEIYYIFLKYIK